MKLTLTLAALAALTLQLTLAQDKKPEPTTAPPVATKQAAKTNPDGTVQIAISLGDLYNAQISLSKLFNMDLPVKTAWGLRKTVSSIEAELKRFNEQRSDLIKKHGGTATTSVPAEKIEGFSADVKALTEIKVNLTITPVSIASLGDGAKLTVGDMARLEPFLIP